MDSGFRRNDTAGIIEVKVLVRKAAVNNIEDVLKLVKNTGCDKRACSLLSKKGGFHHIVIEKIDNRAANILKQEAISCGADAAVNEKVSRFEKGFSNAVLFVTIKQAEILKSKLCLQPFGLKELSLRLDGILKDAISGKKVFRYKKSEIDGKVKVGELINAVREQYSRVFGYKQFPDLYKSGENLINPLDMFLTLSSAITRDLNCGDEIEIIQGGELAPAALVRNRTDWGGDWIFPEKLDATNLVNIAKLQTWTIRPFDL